MKLNLIITLIWAIILTVVYMFWLYKPVVPTVAIKHIPKFSTGSCFVHNGIRESWEELPDGIVTVRGIENYLVMFRDQAERKTAGNKLGTTITIETLDSGFHEVLCPVSWRKH